MGQTFYRFVALLSALAIAAPAAGQDKQPWRYRVTAGPQVKPQYPGADQVSILPMFDIDRARGDTPFEFEAGDDSFGIALLHSGGFSIGPVVNLVGSRKPVDVGAALPKVDRTVEVGGFAQTWLGDNFRLHGELRYGVTGHKGLVGVGGADVVLRERDNWLFSIGPRVTWADNKFHDAYFSVTPASALATGLPVYDAGGGIESYGAAASTQFELSRHLGLYGYAKYDRLTGDAARSPIVLRYGSRDQYAAGIGLSYTF
ncbi:MAG: MipA/OmpV family protein [Croceibacterium sp.]